MSEMKKFTIKIPATSANLGPGFDCLGLALKICNKACVSWHPEADLLSGEQLFNWAKSLPFAQRALAMAYSFYAREKSLKLPRIGISFGGDIPVARGLGSSATCAVAGIAAAQLAHKNKICKDELLLFGAKVEGHPDNVAPAVFGGLMLSKSAGGEEIAVKLPCHENIRPLLLIPPFELETAKARSVLPEMISHKDAVRQLSSFGFLLQGLKDGDAQLIKHGSEDYLHENFRQDLIPDYDLIKQAALAGGCHKVSLSGAGPSLLAFYIGSAAEAEKVRQTISENIPSQWQIILSAVDQEGTVINPDL